MEGDNKNISECTFPENQNILTEEIKLELKFEEYDTDPLPLLKEEPLEPANENKLKFEESDVDSFFRIEEDPFASTSECPLKLEENEIEYDSAEEELLGSVLEDGLEESGSSTSESELSDSDSDDDETLSACRNWSEIDTTLPVGPPPSRFPFLGKPGISPTINLEATANGVLPFFDLYFDDQLINRIVVETNIYAKQSRAGRNSISKWQDVTGGEIRVFLALIILQSIVKKPKLQQYWTNDPMIATPFFRQTMAYRRFVAIKQNLHFSNNEQDHPKNHPNPKLNKIWPLYSDLSQKFSHLYTPERDITVDESLLLNRSKVEKMTRFGIKSYMLRESKTGYIWAFIIYTEKDTNFYPAFKNLTGASQIVLSLIKPLFGMGYCLITGSSYTSPELADVLVSNNIDTYGIMNIRRKEIPPAFKTKKLKYGEITAYQKGKVCILRWKDKRDVTLLSTVHNAQIKTYRKGGVEKKKPIVVLDYDSMGGMDKVDQQLSDYPVTRICRKKYYKKVFFHFLELALWNSYILYKKRNGKKAPLEYRQSLAKEMIEKYHSNLLASTRSRPITSVKSLCASTGHYPDYIPPTEKKQCPTRRCVLCSRKRDSSGKSVRKESRYYCQVCDVGLCIVPCFKTFHTK